MSKKYCTYLTVYLGNKLPPFYIGFSLVENVENGYHGSVSSKQWKSIWKEELLNNPNVFKTIILTKHESKEEAVNREQKFQLSLGVLKKPEMYINRTIGKPLFGCGKVGMKHRKPRSQEYRDQVSKRRRGVPMSQEQKAVLSLLNKGKVLSKETREKMSRSKRGVLKSSETKSKMSVAQKGRTFSEETKRKMSIAAKNRKKS